MSPPFYVDILSGLVTRMPGASIVRIAGVGHAAPISHRGIIAAAVEAFAVGRGWAAGSTLRFGS